MEELELDELEEEEEVGQNLEFGQTFSDISGCELHSANAHVAPRQSVLVAHSAAPLRLSHSAAVWHAPFGSAGPPGYMQQTCPALLSEQSLTGEQSGYVPELQLSSQVPLGLVSVTQHTRDAPHSAPGCVQPPAELVVDEELDDAALETLLDELSELPELEAFDALDEAEEPSPPSATKKVGDEQ